MFPHRGTAAAGVLTAVSLLLLLAPVAADAASPSQNASTTGPHSIWWASSVWNNRIPGDTIRYLFLVYNEDPTNATMTLKALSLQTPWGNYSATGLPASLCAGCRYAWAQYLQIPSSQAAPANVTFYTRLTGGYGSGTALCADTDSVCEDVTPVTLAANSTTIQNNLDMFSTVYLPLGIAVPALVALVVAVLYFRKPSI